MENRRIMSLGRSSLVISLPKYWTRLNGLKPGDAVSIAMSRDRSLVIFPGVRDEKEESKVTLHMESEENITSIIRSIISCYLNGYSYIRLVSKSFFTIAQQKAIRQIAKMLYLQIVEAGSKEIHLTTLTDESKASVESGISVIYKISISMCLDALKALKNRDAALAKSTYALDDEVDHFAFFMLRLLRKAVAFPVLANQLGLDPVDCLDYQTLVHSIEQVADQASSIAQHVIMLEGRGKKISEILLERMYSIGGEALSLYDKAVNAFLSTDKKSSIDVIESEVKIRRLDHEIASLSFSKENDAEVICACCSMRDSIKRIADYAMDIAKAAVNRSYKASS